MGGIAITVRLSNINDLYKLWAYEWHSLLDSETPTFIVSRRLDESRIRVMRLSEILHDKMLHENDLRWDKINHCGIVSGVELFKYG